MDLPLRAKLQLSMVAAALVGGVLTVATGSLLIRHLVEGEAERRAVSGMGTARAALQDRGDQLEHACGMAAQWLAGYDPKDRQERAGALLETLTRSGVCDYVEYGDAEGQVRWPSSETARAMTGPVVAEAATRSRSTSSVWLMPLRELGVAQPTLLQRALVTSEGADLASAMVLEACAPLMAADGTRQGLVRAGILLNRNTDLVDSVRNVAFGTARYRGRPLGTVTLFANGVQVATNVTDEAGRRAIGTRLTGEVATRVLVDAGSWVGPAYVVDDWYVSAYEPLRTSAGSIVGALYAGVLKRRYDDVQRQAMMALVLISVLAALVSATVARWRADRMTRPLTRLMEAAGEIARGNLECRLPEPVRARRDEIKRLTVSFNQMASSLMEHEDELQRSHEQLAATAHELERWNQSYLDTLRFITHELKNQVSAMQINLLAVRDGYVGPLSEDQREALDDVVTAVNRTEEMILNYLNLSRLEKGDLVVKARPVHVADEVVGLVLRELRGRLDESNMRVQVDLAEDLVVQADPSLLQIVYENLISNAAKYGRPGGLLRIWGERQDGLVALHVWNDGDGVPPDQVDELFRKFSRLQPPGEQVRGTGLGLFITREIVRKLGGDIAAQTRPGEGIDFVFTVPRPDVVVGHGEDLPADPDEVIAG
jgi:two-component system, NtrC family, sensor kinase